MKLRLRLPWTRRPSLWKGMLAGAIGGLAATAAKSAAEALYPPRTEGQTPPTVELIRKVSGRRMRRNKEQRISKAIHFGFGTIAGAAYGALAEYRPEVAKGQGTLFGAGLNVLTHETLLPILGLADWPLQQTAREQSSEAATHLLYGLVTESTRAFVRSRI